jgi:putative glutamine amidotransferase
MKYLRYFLLSLIFFSNCTTKKTSMILISKDKNGKIAKWLLNANPDLDIKECYGLSPDSLNLLLQKAKGIVIGGGVDISPEFYHKPEYKDLCINPDPVRDSMEVKMIHYALEHKIPLLAICRGCQMLNVANGGTLIPDLPSVKPEWEIHKSKEDKAHTIKSIEGSWLKTILKIDTAWVNSRHHQAIDLLAPNLKIAALSDDGVIESIELKQADDHPFYIGVQWHPEDLKDELSNKIAGLFIGKVK